MKRKRRAGSPPTLGIFRNSEYPPKIPSGNEGVFLRLLPAPDLPGWHRDRSEFSFHKRCSGRENRYAAKRSERSSSEGPKLWHFCSLDIYIQEARKDGG